MKDKQTSTTIGVIKNLSNGNIKFTEDAPIKMPHHPMKDSNISHNGQLPEDKTKNSRMVASNESSISTLTNSKQISIHVNENSIDSSFNDDISINNNSSNGNMHIGEKAQFYSIEQMQPSGSLEIDSRLNNNAANAVAIHGSLLSIPRKEQQLKQTFNPNEVNFNSQRRISSSQKIKTPTINEKYLAFIRNLRKSRCNIGRSLEALNSFTVSSSATDIGPAPIETRQYPDPIALLDKINDKMQNCHWSSPIISNESVILEILFDNDYEKFLALGQKVTGLSRSMLNVGLSEQNSLDNSISSSYSWSSITSIGQSQANITKELHSFHIGSGSVPEFVDSNNRPDVIDRMDIDKSNEDLGTVSHAPMLPKKFVKPPFVTQTSKANARLLHKFNSCTTIFTIDNTILKPSKNPEHLDITLKSVAHAIHTHLTRTHELYRVVAKLCKEGPHIEFYKFIPRIFESPEYLSEKFCPVWKARKIPDDVIEHPEIMQPPTFEELFQFLKQIFIAADLTSEIAIIALIYLEKMMAKTRTGIFGLNCFRSILGALILASKIWDDQAIWNVDFKTIMSDLDLKGLNDLERWWLKNVDFDVDVKRSLFAKYWFEIRELAERVWGVKLESNNRVSRKIDGTSKKESYESIREILFAPAIRYQKEAQRRKSNLNLDLNVPRPLTEEHINRLSASTSYSQSRIRESFTNMHSNSGYIGSSYQLSNNTYLKQVKEKHIPVQPKGQDVSISSIKERSETEQVSRPFEYGGSNLRRTKSDFQFTPVVPPASVL